MQFIVNMFWYRYVHSQGLARDPGFLFPESKKRLCVCSPNRNHSNQSNHQNQPPNHCYWPNYYRKSSDIVSLRNRVEFYAAQLEQIRRYSYSVQHSSSTSSTAAARTHCGAAWIRTRTRPRTRSGREPPCLPFIPTIAQGSGA